MATRNRLTRRASLFAIPGLFISTLGPRTSLAGNVKHETATSDVGKRDTRRQRLDQVRTWGCQFQNTNVEQIANSELDLIVVDHALGEPDLIIANPREITQIKTKPNGERRLVLAYLSVGEAENYRPYWNGTWNKKPPSWLGPTNPKWPGAYTVKFWDPDWKDIVYKGKDAILPRILAAGFDGVFLDRVDGYLDWEQRRPAAPFEMIDLVTELADIARTDAPEFLVISQNSEPLLKQHLFRNAIDGVSKECLLYGLAHHESENSKADIAWSLGGLNAARRDGIPVFAIEYLDDLQKIDAARKELKRLGFIPFFGNRALDRLPQTTPQSTSRPNRK